MSRPRGVESPVESEGHWVPEQNIIGKWRPNAPGRQRGPSMRLSKNHTKICTGNGCTWRNMRSGPISTQAEAKGGLGFGRIIRPASEAVDQEIVDLTLFRVQKDGPAMSADVIRRM